MAKLTKQTLAAVSKGKKEQVAKPKTTRKPTAKSATKPVSKPVAKTPVKTPRTKKVALSDKTKEVKPKATRAPKRVLTDTSKLRKYNNQLRENLRNLIYDKNLNIAEVARKMGLSPSYLFNVLRVKDKEGNESNGVIALDIAYGICSVIGANISSVLPEAEIVNPIYKTKTDVTDKVNELQEENVKLNFLFTQTKQQLDTQSVKLAASEARVKELENFLESSFNKIGKIRERLANTSKSEESKS